jgi:subtilase family serine protease
MASMSRPLTSRGAAAFLSLVFSLLLLLSPFASSAVLHTAVPSVWQSIAPVNGSQPHLFFLSLPNRNVDELESRLAELSDPLHPSYGRWMTAAEVDAVIAPLPSTVSAVHDWLLSSGVPSSHITRYSDAFEVQTTVDVVNRLFNASLHEFEHSEDASYHVAAKGSISVPDDVLPHLAMILGVNNFPFPTKHYSVRTASRPNAQSSAPSPSPSSSAPDSTSGAHAFHPMQTTYYYDVMVPRDLAAYYGYPDVTQFGRPSNYAANTSIAVTQFDGKTGNTVIHESIAFADITSQGSFSDVPGIQSSPSVYGTNVQTSPQDEPSLDIQTITTSNPTANAWHWEETYTVWIYGLSLHLKAQATPPQVVSISWGSTESGADSGSPDGITQGYVSYLTQTEVQLAALGAMGVTIIAASGDNGASGANTAVRRYHSHTHTLHQPLRAAVTHPRLCSPLSSPLCSATTTVSGSSPGICTSRGRRPPLT